MKVGLIAAPLPDDAVLLLWALKGVLIQLALLVDGGCFGMNLAGGKESEFNEHNFTYRKV